MQSKKDKHILYWIKSAKKDLKAAHDLFEKKNYPHSLFFGHLVLEKTLKALYVKNVGLDAPYKHSLPRLANEAKIELSEEQLDFLEIVTRFNVESRYPDIKFKFFKLCNKKFTEIHIQQIKDFYKWLLKTLKSKPK